jgi:hypothetical protein
MGASQDELSMPITDLKTIPFHGLWKTALSARIVYGRIRGALAHSRSRGAASGPRQETNTRATSDVPVAEQATFRGHRRVNGKVGTRNYPGVPTSAAG